MLLLTTEKNRGGRGGDCVTPRKAKIDITGAINTHRSACRDFAAELPRQFQEAASNIIEKVNEIEQAERKSSDYWD